MQLKVLHSHCHWKTLRQTCRIYFNAAIHLMKDTAQVQYSPIMIHPMKRGLLIMFLCSLMVYLWSLFKELLDNTQVTALLAWKMEYILSICMLVNGLFSTYLSILLLWMFSIMCIYTTDHLGKPHGKCKGWKKKHGTRSSSKGKQVKVLSASDRIANVEKFMDFFQELINKEQHVTTEVETIAEKIFKLQSAYKQLNRVQVIVDSLNQTLYIHQYDIGMLERMHDLLNKFDYIKAYVELRQHLLTLVEKQFLVFLEQGKELKIWLSDAVEFQEDLHHVVCNSHLVVQKQLSQTQVLRNQSTMIAGKLEEFKSTANHLTSTLQELGSFSDGFQIALRKDTGKHEKRWSDTLMNSVTEEMTQVGERFSTVLQLNACYQTHLQGLLLPCNTQHNAVEDKRFYVGTKPDRKRFQVYK